MTSQTMTVENWRDTWALVLKYLAIGAMTFQAVHLLEHVAQLGYWLAHPVDAPWLTPWAARGREALAVGGQLGLGNELLHLFGNVIFLAGLAALTAFLRYRGPGQFRALRMAVAVQGLHVLEHMLLTGSSAFVGKAIGVSTFLGLVEGPVMTSYRVWFHFLLNLVASWYAGRTLAVMHRERLLVEVARGASGRGGASGQVSVRPTGESGDLPSR